ncbi:MAG TPA: porin, partial [Paraburkholderia sp.]
MKYTKGAVVLLAAGTLSGVAHAQNSVTLYGVVDAGILVNSNVGGKQQYSMSQGNSSRWGLKGAEDLGDGLHAIFNIESGFTTATGSMAQGGLLFGRRAIVGLSSDRWGTLTGGRQFSTTTDFVGPFASGADWAASGAALGTHTSDIDNLDGANRIQNSVKYVSPIVNGFQAGALYSFGGVAGDFTNRHVLDASVSYSNGPFRMAAGYNFTKDPYYATYGDQGNSSTSVTGTNDNMNNKIYGGYASAASQQIIAVGSSFALGPAIVGIVYSNTQFGGLGSVEAGGALSAPKYAGGSATFNTGEVN